MAPSPVPAIMTSGCVGIRLNSLRPSRGNYQIGAGCTIGERTLLEAQSEELPDNIIEFTVDSIGTVQLDWILDGNVFKKLTLAMSLWPDDEAKKKAISRKDF